MLRFGLAATLAILAAASVPPAFAQPAAPVADAVCRSLETYAADANPQMPQAVDGTTAMTGIRVDCAARTLTFMHRFTVTDRPVAELTERARGVFLAGICDQGIAAATGWAVVAEFYGPDDALADTFATTEADCEALDAGAPMPPEQLAAFVATAAEAFQTQLPIQLEEGLEIVAARGEAGVLVYEVRLARDMATAAVEIDELLRGGLVPALCSTSQMGILYRAGATARIAVTDITGRERDIALGPEDCAAALAAPAPAPAPGAPDAGPSLAAECSALEAFAADTNRYLPQRADDVLETLEVRVDCAAATVTFARRLLVAPAAIPTGYFDQQLLRHRETHCGVNGLASRFAMTAIDEIQALDGTAFTEIVTTPADCDGFTAAMADAATILTAQELDERLEAIVLALQPRIPLQLNDSVTLTAVFHGTGALVYFYRLGYAVPPSDRAALEARMVDVVRQQECTDDETRLYLRSGAAFTYRYSDSGNVLLFSVMVTAADCGLI